MPIVSVIIPTYNCSGLLRQSVESVLLQEMDDFELWVIGDGCTDDSRKVVEGFGDPRVFWHNLRTNSGGPGTPRNEGLRRARGQYVAYLGHDDLWFPWHLSRRPARPERYPSSTASLIRKHFLLTSSNTAISVCSKKIPNWPFSMHRNRAMGLS